MNITSQIQTTQGKFTAEYHDADEFGHLPQEQCSQVYGVCFYKNLIILARTTGGMWLLPGGTIEPGETFE
jgi:hypothetical protein